MKTYPTCNMCQSDMTKFDGCAWYTCPNCGQAIRDNQNGTWTWHDEIFGRPKKNFSSDFDEADFCRGGDLSEY